MKESLKVEITTKTILTFLGILGLTYLIFLLRNIVVIFIFAYIIYSGLKPIVDRLERRKIPSWLSITLIYLGLFIFFALIIFLTIDTLFSQFQLLINDFPGLVKTSVEKLNQWIPESKRFLDSSQIGSDIKDYLEKYTETENLDTTSFVSIGLEALNVLRIGGFTILNSVVGGFLSLVAMLASSIYMLTRPGIFLEGAIELLPIKDKKGAINLLKKIQIGLNEWISGQLILMFTIGALSYIAVFIPSILNIESYDLNKFALLIGVIAGLLEAFPGIGPTITLIIATILAIGSGSSVGMIVYVIISFLSIQQFEGFFVVPHVMKRVVKIDPVLGVLGILAGIQLFGIFGALLSIPAIATIQVVLFELKARKAKVHTA